MQTCHRMTTLFKTCIFIILLCTTMVNVCNARVAIGIGTGYSSSVQWIPGHWYEGYWVPGQYVEYVGPSPELDYLWIGGGYDHYHHWHHGYGGHGGWGHGGGHRH